MTDNRQGKRMCNIKYKKYAFNLKNAFIILLKVYLGIYHKSLNQRLEPAFRYFIVYNHESN